MRGVAPLSPTITCKQNKQNINLLINLCLTDDKDPLRRGKHYCESLCASPSTTSTWKFQFDELRLLK